VQRDVEHVAQIVLSARLAVARQQRGHDAILARQRCDQWIVGQMPAGAMQEQEILAFAGFEDLDARAGRLERYESGLHVLVIPSSAG
jgi:hypothetical protein